MLVTLPRIVMSVKRLQLQNAKFPMLATLPGISMLSKTVQSKNAKSTIFVMPSSITTFFTLSFFWAAGLLPAPYSFIAPVPLMVSVPSASSAQVRLSSFQRVTTLFATSPKFSLVSVEPPSRSTSVRSVQPSNTLLPILVTLFGMVMLVKSVQLSNADSPMLVTLLGIVMSVKLLQPENAPFPMLVTLPGIVMSVKLLQSENAESPMLVTPSSITTFFMLLLSHAGLS